MSRCVQGGVTRVFFFNDWRQRHLGLLPKKEMSNVVYRSAVASLFVQLLVGLVTAGGFFVPLPDEEAEDLRLIFGLELGSQLIEFVYYLLVVCWYREIQTWTRYLDWVISTPAMLLSTILFFRHRASEVLVPDTFEMGTLYACLGLNWLMLSFGFAMEASQAVSRGIGLALGGAAFVGSFTVLSLFLASTDALSVGLYVAMYAVWSLYGVAAALDDVPKNVAYNALDIVSKNFYGIFLLVYAIARAE